MDLTFFNKKIIRNSIFLTLPGHDLFSLDGCTDKKANTSLHFKK